MPRTGQERPGIRRQLVPDALAWRSLVPGTPDHCGRGVAHRGELALRTGQYVSGALLVARVPQADRGRGRVLGPAQRRGIDTERVSRTVEGVPGPQPPGGLVVVDLAERVGGPASPAIRGIYPSQASSCFQQHIPVLPELGFCLVNGARIPGDQSLGIIGLTESGHQ